MLSRPWPIRILAALFTLAPFINAFILSRVWDVTFFVYLRMLIDQPISQILETWIPLPLAGICIYAMRRWSYLCFFFLTGFVLLQNFIHRADRGQMVSVPMIIAFSILNFGVVAYFLIPAVRVGYFNPRLRWWEALPRYCVEIPVNIDDSGNSFSGQSLDLSAGGTLVEMKGPFQPLSEPVISFRYEDAFVFELKASLVHHRAAANHPTQTSHLYGLQFHSLQLKDKRRLRLLALELALDGHERLQPPPPLWKDFKEWLRSDFKRGKGMIPAPKGFVKTPSNKNRHSC